jgi:hypothetical protein
MSTLVADATGTASLVGGDGNDRFLFTSSAQLANNTVVGGEGTDTLVLTAATTLADTQLANVSGVEVIQASSLASAVVLGLNAQAGGVVSLFGGAASDSLSAAGMNRGNIWIQGSKDLSTVGDTLVAGTGISKSTLVGNNSTTANNYYQISAVSLLGNNSIVGGASSADYLQITGSSQIVTDASFAQTSGLDGLILTGGANSITLGTAAASKGIATVIGGTGKDTINATDFNANILIDASAGTGARLLGSTVAGKNNTLIGGSTGGNRVRAQFLGQ